MTRDRTSEEKLLARAMARGWVDAADVDWARTQQDFGEPVIESLVAIGALPKEQARELEDGAMALAATKRAEAPIAPAATASEPDLSSWTRYEIKERVGKGGFGVVMRARDPRLGRSVALKFVAHDDPLVCRALIEEARVQARVDHPHVCKVYEVGVVGGQPFIAMQFIDGSPLEKAAARLSTRLIVRLIAQVASALQAAHAVGLVHRDLKPSNIMVEGLGSPTPHAYLVDFGLAQQNAELRLGEVSGTPAFMAPEQASGGNVTESADVYALGATLYTLLAGRAPFAGSIPSILYQVLNEPVPPLRTVTKRDVPEDLAAIVHRCLAKRPTERYPSARALERDLQRFLDGNPVAAMPPRIGYRLGKRVRKHPWSSAAIVALSLGLLGGASQYAYTRWQNAVRERAAVSFTAKTARVDALLTLAEMAPLHDLRPARTEARRLMNEIEMEAALLGDVVTAQKEEALGRSAHRLGALDEARRHLERALASRDSDDVAAELGSVLIDLYRTEQRRFAALGPTERLARRRELRRELIEPARALLARASSSSTGGKLLAQRMALADGHTDEVRRLANLQVKDVPWLAEPLLIAGAAVVADHHDLATSYDPKAQVLLEEAGAWYGQAALVARSSFDAHAGRCSAEVQRMELRRRHDRNANVELGDVERECALALTVDPDSAEVRAQLARAHSRVAEARFNAGIAIEPAATVAEQMATEALRLEPTHRLALVVVANVASLRADVAVLAKEDPRPALDKAQRAYDAAIRVWDGFECRLGQSAVWKTRASWEAEHDVDPRPTLAKARDAGQAALRLNGKSVLALDNLGNGWVDEASWLVARGLDPTAAASAAESAYRATLAMAPTDGSALIGIGIAAFTRGVHERLAGRDPTRWLTEAEQRYRAALQVETDSIVAAFDLVEALRHHAEWEAHTGRDPRALLDEIERRVAKLDLVEAQVEQVRALLVRARRERTRISDAARVAAAAERRVPSSAEVMGVHAYVLATQAFVMSDRELAAEAQRRADRALALAPTNAQARVARALALRTATAGGPNDLDTAVRALPALRDVLEDLGALPRRDGMRSAAP